MKEIAITEIENISIGQFENTDAATGCTVFVSKEGMPAGLDVRGGGPASRESEILKPLANAPFIHSIVLSGGSAFGLGVSDGVMKYLEENDIGFDVGICKVPLVCQSGLFDLTVGRSDVRPDASYGYAAAKIALEGGNYRDGNYGAGCGCTVGKWNGMASCMKTGIGSYALQIGELKIGAVVSVNSLGDIYDYKTGRLTAGMLTPDGRKLCGTVRYMMDNMVIRDNKFVGNTTIGVVITNAAFEKVALCKIASMAQNGIARSVKPVHTSADGDSLYAVSVGSIRADKDAVGTIAADVVSEAILRAVYASRSAYGYPSIHDINI